MKNILSSYNPVTKELLGEVNITEINNIEKIVEDSKIAQKKWEEISIDQRIELLKKGGFALNQNLQDLAILLSQEMGKDFNRSYGEVSGCASDIEYKGSEIKEAIKTKAFENYGIKTQLQYNPLGVCAVIAPWNYPMAMAHWLIIPSLVAGNSVVFKPSEETPLIAQKYVDALNKFLPKNVLQIIHGDKKQGESFGTRGYKSYRIYRF